MDEWASVGKMAGYEEYKQKLAQMWGENNQRAPLNEQGTLKNSPKEQPGSSMNSSLYWSGIKSSKVNDPMNHTVGGGGFKPGWLAGASAEQSMSSSITGGGGMAGVKENSKQDLQERLNEIKAWLGKMKQDKK